ncbi:MAG: adenosine deaminase [Propionibacteriaceae bacterium]|jgi:adenosine deaminase|nr:adenosine deaminase [Propionibacteriaceae bacterium]
MELIEQIRRSPKVSLHDHLDGGLRPSTIIDLAGPAGVDLPETTPEALGRWFFDQANAGSLVAYLKTFEVTIAVMQTYDNLRRVAKEAVLDQADDGVVYTEIRWAPILHTRAGLSEEDAIRAVRDGLAEGTAEALAQGRVITARQLLCELRGMDPTPNLAELAIAYRDDSVVGLDCAGPELGFSSATYVASYQTALQANMMVTIHAGEADGLAAIHEALHVCGAHRIGHGVRLIDDIQFSQGQSKLGRLAEYVASLRIPLEISPTSNLQTGIARDLAHHPFDDLYRAGIRVTVNCDNRLMSMTTLTRELASLADTFGYSMGDIRRFTLNAAKSAFLPWEEKRVLIHEMIAPGYAGYQRATIETADYLRDKSPQ